MQLVLASDLALVREKYIEVIEHTKDMNIHARWIYGQHPTDTLIQSYIDRQQMYLYMDGKIVAGMTAITMYQGADYHEILWSQNLNDDEVASLHILTVTPEYQGKGVSIRMMEAIMLLVMEKGKKAIRLDTLASNIPAQHMYEKLGFAYRGKQNLYAENTGWTDFLYYELPLNHETLMKPFRHKTLEERAAEFGGQLNLDGEYDWGEQTGGENEIGIFAISTFNTDYILTKKENYDKAIDVLNRAGYQITE